MTFTFLDSQQFAAVSMPSNLSWQFSNLTSLPAGTGEFRFNQTTIAAATQMFISYTGQENTRWDEFLSDIELGTFVYIKQRNDSSNTTMLAELTGIVGVTTTYRIFNITIHRTTGDGIFDNESVCDFEFLPTRQDDKGLARVTTTFSTSSNTYQQALLLNFTPRTTSQYKLDWHFTWEYDRDNRDIFVRVTQQTLPSSLITELFEYQVEPKEDNRNQQIPLAGYDILSLTAGTTYQFRVEVRCTNNGDDADINKRVLSIARWR